MITTIDETFIYDELYEVNYNGKTEYITGFDLIDKYQDLLDLWEQGIATIEKI